MRYPSMSERRFTRGSAARGPPTDDGLDDAAEHLGVEARRFQMTAPPGHEGLDEHGANRRSGRGLGERSDEESLFLIQPVFG